MNGDKSFSSFAVNNLINVELAVCEDILIFHAEPANETVCPVKDCRNRERPDAYGFGKHKKYGGYLKTQNNCGNDDKNTFEYV